MSIQETTGFGMTARTCSPDWITRKQETRIQWSSVNCAQPEKAHNKRGIQPLSALCFLIGTDGAGSVQENPISPAAVQIGSISICRERLLRQIGILWPKVIISFAFEQPGERNTGFQSSTCFHARKNGTQTVIYDEKNTVCIDLGDIQECLCPTRWCKGWN